ncbi:2-succinylbenzoate--CoA ligase [Moorena producens JHB]|uniref:2-succinylbenzoate--CoA ligase n=1 Tax=Moorena producens (strain JHB) TaxID=1454205 RepID=A0A1D9GB39_MOOP1|nr:2-succinylbenzoate--CoA ligase [Moorena producens]AOY84744.2 2-succinylbenzoate--CoA ligase [Moorena producens JHB]
MVEALKSKCGEDSYVQQPLSYVQQRSGEQWLIGYDSQQLNQLIEQYCQQFSQLAQEKAPKILLVEQNHLKFLATFLAAVASNCHVFLGNPHWVKPEWQQVLNQIHPDLIIGELASIIEPSILNNQHSTLNNQYSIINNYPSALIMIPTGGSSGKIRFAIHTWETLMASVAGFDQYFGNKPVNSFCVLPLYHVSGLMQFMRSLTTGGRMVILPFKALKAGQGRDIDPKEFFISLVPTQLAKLINQDAADWLSRFRTVLLGGAPAWESLLTQARQYRIPLALTYGMTETASGVVTLKPEDFLSGNSGNNSCGQVLPHAKVTIRNGNGEIVKALSTGVITIEAKSLFHGYYSASTNLALESELSKFPNRVQTLQSDDLGYFDQQGYLYTVGRRSNKIITGGENVFPAEVEQVIRGTGLVSDVCVIGLPDDYWGQVVTAVFVPSSDQVSVAMVQQKVEGNLSKFKCPKNWVAVESLPRNGQGKLNYQQVKVIARDGL